jgi:hypothetical protein
MGRAHNIPSNMKVEGVLLKSGDYKEKMSTMNSENCSSMSFV